MSKRDELLDSSMWSEALGDTTRGRPAPGKVPIASRTSGSFGGSFGGAPGRATLTRRIAGSMSPAPAVTASNGAAPVQRKPAADNMFDAAFRPDLHRPSGHTNMPEPVQAKMESAFDADFSSVKVHSSSARATELGAQAYTQGTDIHFAPGQYAPNSAGGQELLGHELAHVVQQAEGRVSANAQAKGVAMNADPALESEADRAGEQAARGERVATRASAPHAGAGVVQRRLDASRAGAHQPVQRRTAGQVADSAIELAQAFLEFLAEGDARSRGKLARRVQSLAASANTTHPAARQLASRLARADLEAVYADAGQKATLGNMASELLAEQHEHGDGGHSLDRHGPEVTDQELITRLETGIAPDGAESPAPGMSTRFVDHSVWLETRTAAVEHLQAAIVATQAAILPLIPALVTASGERMRAEWEVRGPQQAVNTATTKKRHKQDQYNRATRRQDAVPNGMTQQQFEQVRQQSLGRATQEETTARAALRGPGDALRNAQGAETTARAAIAAVNQGLPFNTQDGNPNVSATDYATMRNYYTVTLDHGKAVGEGFQGTNPENPVTAEANARAAGHNSVANKIQTGQATLYTGHTAVNGLQKTATGLRPPENDMPLVEGVGENTTARAIDVNGWTVVQHFPADNAANVGVA